MMRLVDRFAKLVAARRADARRLRELEAQHAALVAAMYSQQSALLKLISANNDHVGHIHEIRAVLAHQSFHVDAIREFIMKQSETLPGEGVQTQQGRRAH